MPTTLATFLLMMSLAGACPMIIGAVPTADGRDINVALHGETRHETATAMDQEEKGVPCEQCDDHVREPTKLLASAGALETFAPASPLAVLPAESTRIAQGSVITQQAVAIRAPPEIALLRTIVLRT